MEKIIENLDQDGVLDIITDFPIEPLFNRVVITLNVVEQDLALKESSLDEVQYIVATGPVSEKSVQAGQKVLIDLNKLTVREPSQTDATQMVSRVAIEPIYIDDVMYAIIDDRFIKAKDNR